MQYNTIEELTAGLATYWKDTVEDETFYYEVWPDPTGEPGCDAEDDTCAGLMVLAASKHDDPVGLCLVHAIGQPSQERVTENEYNASDQS